MERLFTFEDFAEFRVPFGVTAEQVKRVLDTKQINEFLHTHNRSSFHSLSNLKLEDLCTLFVEVYHEKLRLRKQVLEETKE